MYDLRFTSRNVGKRVAKGELIFFNVKEDLMGEKMAF